MSRGIKIAHNDKEVQRKIVAQDVNSVSGIEVYAPSDKITVKFAPPPKNLKTKVAPKAKVEVAEKSDSKEQKNKIAMQMMMQEKTMSR